MKKNKSLLIISLMQGCPWGGSEELWFKTAIHSLSEGTCVDILIKKWPNDHVNITKLRLKGAKIHYFNDNQPKKKGIVKRLISKSSNTNDTGFGNINLSEIDKVLVSQGDTFSAFGNVLFQNLLKTNKPIYLISEHLSDTGIPNDNMRKIARNSLNRIEKFFFVSNRSLELTKRYLNSNGDNFLLVNNPVNLNNKVVVEYPKKKTPSFGVVARLDCKFKGQDVLIEVLSQEKWKLREWECNLYGDGPDYEYLNSLITAYGLNNKIFIRGHYKSVKEIWDLNHVLILPSISEGTPLSLVEAQISGRVSVGTDVGGIAEVIEDGINGWIAQAPLKHYLDDAMEKAWHAMDKWEEMGQVAHNMIMKRYHKDAGEELYNIIYRS
ncbi:glycosyltransferase family 4 protein [Tamlana haliotis]|uniref:Glycosyltransferase family 4 protein n=1 Tax=Pseudotamlana haliotis TaxID=2614804 RepID=A0A6N6MCH5_9FLAO|nr:glycosyltransferase [Tamlana haliotis]KAB1067018.1 glycosyltransferase family 4 protein [Tamlana haliotis]